jgi:hypothetical protein
LILGAHSSGVAGILGEYGGPAICPF